MKKSTSKFEGSQISFGGACAAVLGLSAVAAGGNRLGNWATDKVVNAGNAIAYNDKLAEEEKKRKSEENKRKSEAD